MNFQPIVSWPVLLIAAVAGALVAWGRLRRGAPRGSALRWLALWLVLLVMTTDPSVGGTRVSAVATNADVLFVVDTTGSISAEDYNGNRPRLEGVRADVVDIATHFPGARYSLITFDTDASLELPWTTDLGALTSLVEVVDQERTAYSQGSRLDVATEMTSAALGRSAKSGDRLRYVFFFSDGEQSEQRSFAFAGVGRQIAGGAVLGYGTERGAKMRDFWGRSSSIGNDGYIYDYATGEDAVSRIDERNLRTVADQLGVTYVHRTEPGGVEQLTQAAAAGAKQRFTDRDSGALQGSRHLGWVLGFAVLALAGWQVVDAFQAARIARQMVRPSAPAAAPHRARREVPHG